MNKTSPRDFFLHLMGAILLYVAAGSFISLVFSIVNIYLPDNLEYGYALQGAKDTLRFSLSSLVVVFPVYLVINYFLQKIYRVNPDKKNLRIRKWLIYFTLFVAAGIIMGDLVTLINFFLKGEITLRFILKVFALFFVSGAIFGYYLWDLKRNKEGSLEQE